MRGSLAYRYIQGVAYMGAICKAGVNPAICVTSFQGMVRTGLIKTQGAGPLEARKKCSAVEINKLCIIIKHLGQIGIFWLGFLRVFLNFLTILTSFWKLKLY